VFPEPVSLYARWRAPAAPAVLRETAAGPPPERLLQAVWQQQRLQRDRLRTLDGQPLRVLHPGFWNHEAGPDFREAVIQIGAEPPRVGDVEIDLTSANWRGHAHQDNPAYRRVILHVVWNETKPASLTTLALEPFLDAPLAELAHWLGGETVRALPAALAGQCAAPLKELSPEKINQLLDQAAFVRLHAKAAQFQARARQAGWEPALWEGLFRALGYKQNVWPMQRVAELLPQLAEAGQPPLWWQARLLGVSGLLPAELTRTQRAADDYLRRVWDAWWRERERFSDVLLPRAVWRFHGLRPANHPQRRLALAAHWLAGGGLPARLEKWLSARVADGELACSLLEVLAAGPEDFWSWHWTLRSARMKAPQPLLGAARVTDLAVNVILPWLWLRAAASRNETLRRTAEHRLRAWPAGEDNAVLKLARQRLLGGGARRLPVTAATQQGLLQIVRDFCDHSNALCEQCRFPELVRAL